MGDAARLAGEVSRAALIAGDPDQLDPLPTWLEPFAEDEAYGWAITAWRRAAAVPGAWFDHALAEGVVAEWPSWARLTTDRFAGVPFKLLPWQEMIVRLLVGWMVPSEVVDPLTHEPAIVHGRLFKRLILWIPRKNGKSEFLAALALMFAGLDQLREFEGYVFARDEDQAKVTLNRMKSIAANSPQLAGETLPFKRSLYFKTLAGAFHLLSGAEDGKHGRMPSIIVGDEIHEWRSTAIADTLRQGTGTRLEPIELWASTTGRKSNLVGLGVWDESQAILDGRIDDPTTLVVIFAAEPEADYRDEKAWAKANPSLGLSPTLAYLRREAALCADNPRKEAEFRCFHLNQWIDPVSRWLNIKRWDACAGSKDGWTRYPESLRGRLCFGAFDVSSTQDVTALIWLFPPTADDPKWRILPRFWVPEASAAKRVRDDQVPYDRFIAARALETTPGDYVDQNFVAQAIRDGLEAFDVQRIGFDPWNARKLIADLERDGVPIDLFVEMRQGIQTLGEPTKEFERLVYAGVMDHGGHPVLRWMAGNAVVRFDENLNFAPAKKRSRDKIDGIVAAVMATGLASAGEEQMPTIGANALRML